MIDGKLERIPSSIIKRLEKLKSHRSKDNYVISVDIATIISEISYRIKREIGLIIDRNGNIENVIIGSHDEIVIPVLRRFKLIAGRLRGIRLIRTGLKVAELDEDDLTDLALLRLDSVTVISIDSKGLPSKILTGYLLPPNPTDSAYYKYLDDTDVYQQSIDYYTFIESLEDEIIYKTSELNLSKNSTLAVLTGVFKDRNSAARNLSELAELARSAGVEVIDTIYQIRNKVDPKYIIGEGKLKEVVIKVLSTGAEYLIYDNNLTPSQSRMIGEWTEIKVIDRTQLILDIFANRAKDNDGKLIVELAQLKYVLPRLGSRDDSLSRLTGGIGGKGPGETKLEIDKRRVSERIDLLSKKLKKIGLSREVKRSRRTKNDIPIVSIIGYTNAGKSTFLNKLTNSNIYADDRMFATLETSSRRIRFPEEKEIIITDTVGFIRNLPTNLLPAFKSTLEEIENSDLFLHIVDISNSDHDRQIAAVETVLDEMDLKNIDKIIIFNKSDLVDQDKINEVLKTYPAALSISAIDRGTYKDIIDKLCYHFFK